MSSSFFLLPRTENFFIDLAYGSKEIYYFCSGKIDSFQKESMDNWKTRLDTIPAGKPVPQNPQEPFTFIASWEVAQLNNKYLSFLIKIYYFSGGAHGNGTEPLFENFENFNFDSYNLIIYFQRYQVAPGAVGSLTVRVSRQMLEQNSLQSDYLK